MSEIVLIDVCLSDYFRGSSNTVFAVPVHNTTTAQDIKNGILYDYNNDCCYEEIENIELLIDELLFDCTKDEPLFPELELFDENLEPVYAYFEYRKDED